MNLLESSSSLAVSRISSKKKKKNSYMGTSLVVQWLRPHTFTAEDLGLILVREQRFHKLHRVAKKRESPT